MSDGIDISGSEFNIKNINFKSIGDKAISVGENSSLIFSDVEVDSANIGLASKDYSTIDGQNLLLQKMALQFIRKSLNLVRQKFQLVTFRQIILINHI